MLLPVTPLLIASRSGDSVLQRVAQSHQRFEVSASIEIEPLVTKTIAAGTTMLVGTWEDLDDVTGPQSASVAYKNKSLQRLMLGERRKIPLKLLKKKFQVFNEQTEASESWNPGSILIALIGKTTAPFSGGSAAEGGQYLGALANAIVHYHFRFFGTKDNSKMGSLSATEVPKQEVTLKEAPGVEAQLEMKKSTVLARHLLKAKRTTKARAGLSKFAASLLTGLSGLLPPPWNLVLGGGAIIVQAAANSTDDILRLNLYETLSDVAQGEPQVGQKTQTVPLQLENGFLQQINDPESEFIAGEVSTDGTIKGLIRVTERNPTYISNINDWTLVGYGNRDSGGVALDTTNRFQRPQDQGIHRIAAKNPNGSADYQFYNMIELDLKLNSTHLIMSRGSGTSREYAAFQHSELLAAFPTTRVITPVTGAGYVPSFWLCTDRITTSGKVFPRVFSAGVGAELSMITPTATGRPGWQNTAGLLMLVWTGTYLKAYWQPRESTSTAAGFLHGYLGIGPGMIPVPQPLKNADEPAVQEEEDEEDESDQLVAWVSRIRPLEEDQDTCLTEEIDPIPE